MHKMIFQVDRDINNLRFNTGISAMMIFLNDVYSAYPEGKNVPRKIVENLTLCLSPFAPHICEEIWESLGNTQSLSDHDWPSYDPKLTVEDEITLVIQINGKVRDRLTAAADVTEASLKEAVLQREHVQKHLAGKEIRKFIYVKGKLVSIVV